jgi:peroxiredoxin
MTKQQCWLQTLRILTGVVTVTRVGVRNPRPLLHKSTGTASTWTARTIAAVVILALPTGCASNAPETTQTSPHSSPHRSEPTSAPIRVVYEDHEKTSEGPFNLHADLVFDGPHHVRYAVTASGFASSLYVYDGHRLLVHDPEEYRPWQLYDAPEEHRDQYEVVTGWTATPNSAEFAKNCHSAKVIGHQTVLGRPTVGYHCAARHYADGSSMSAQVMWLDQATGVMLKSGALHATVFDQHPHLTADTFDTEPPAGAKVEHYAAQGDTSAGGKSAPNFHLRNVRDTGPRTVSLADYAHRPVVLAFFASDLAFSSETDSPHELGSLRSLDRLTSAGTEPAVLGIQGGDQGKPGLPLIPKNMPYTIVNDPGLDVQHAYGLSNQVGYALIGSDGKVHQVFDNPPTDQRLQEALDKLK